MLKNGQVTLLAGITRISTKRVPCKMIQFQNNAAHNFRIGDATTSATTGIQLAAGAPGGANSIGPTPIYDTDLSEWYAFGTEGELVDFIYIT